MKISRADENSLTREAYDPVFRVYFHDSLPEATRGATEVFDVSGLDVVQAINWAQRIARNQRTFSIALIDGRTRSGDVSITWLVGCDGNDDALAGSSDVDQWVAAQQRRMLLRRQCPVGIAPFDEAPSADLDA